VPTTVGLPSAAHAQIEVFCPVRSCANCPAECADCERGCPADAEEHSLDYAWLRVPAVPGVEHIVVLMLENHSFDNFFGGEHRFGLIGCLIAIGYRAVSCRPFSGVAPGASSGLPGGLLWPGRWRTISCTWDDGRPEEGIPVKTLTYSESRAHYVVDDREEVIITRAGHEPVVMVALSDYESLKETAYLLRSPENARRLLASIDRLEHGGGIARDLAE
jgi:antitoxin YefM